MPEFRYAKGRILDSLAFITQEMHEFDADYALKTWEQYRADTKLQKLIDRTIENILTAVIEVCGVVLTENNISADSYAEVLQMAGKFFGYAEKEIDRLATCAIQRNRLAHRYLNFRWQVVTFYTESRGLLKRLVGSVYQYEISKKEGA